MTAKEKELEPQTQAAAGGDGAGDEDLESEEPEEISIRADPLPQQSASPVDIDRGLRLIQLCRAGDLTAVRSHVTEGSPAGFISKTGWTPLAAAAFGGHCEIVTYLLEIGADLMYKTNKRSAVDAAGLLGVKTSGDKSNCGVNTPLHWASYKGHLGALAILLHAGYSIEDVDPLGNRCLHLACSGGHRDVVELLLANSAVVDQRNQYGNRPVDLATDTACHKLLLKFQSQSTCEWCKEVFTRIRRPSLCQHCHNIYCDARPCSSYSEHSSSSPAAGGGGGKAKAMRFCQECASEMGKAEQDLRSLLESKLELIRHTLGLLGSKTDSALASGRGGSRLSGDSSRPGSSTSLPDTVSDATPTASEEGTTMNGGGGGETSAATTASTAGDSPFSEGSPTKFDGDRLSHVDGESGEESRTPGRDGESTAGDASSTSTLQTGRKRLLTSEEMARALSLSQTDAEALYTAIEAAQAKAANPELIQLARRTYHQLVAHVTLQEEIKSLMVVRPIGIRSLVESLKSALQLAQREGVSEPMLQLAIQVIQGAEAECTLFGCNALCEKIAVGSKKFSKDIARLEASIAEAQLLGANDKLLASAAALRSRLNAEIMLEECLLPFSTKVGVSPETGAEVTTYLFVDGTVALSLLHALELQLQKVTSAVESGGAVEGVSPQLLEDGANALKQLKKDIREETKNEEERRRLEDEAAAKAAKKGKKKA